MKMNKEQTIYEYLSLLIPNPKCELNYNTDYELLIAIMLSAQTTDKRVNKVTSILFNKYPNLKTLKDAKKEDIEQIVRELGSFHKKSKAVIDIVNIIYNNYNGIVPQKRFLLEQLPLVGRKTTNVFLSEYYKVPNIAVDTHVERVSKRLKLAKEKDTVLEIEKKLKRKFPKETWNDLHLRLVLFGRYYCTARTPNCKNCKLKEYCNYKNKS